MPFDIVVCEKGNPLIAPMDRVEPIGATIAHLELGLDTHAEITTLLELETKKFPLLNRLDDYYGKVEWKLAELDSLIAEVQVLENKIDEMQFPEVLEWIRTFNTLIMKARKSFVSVYGIPD